MRRNRLSEDRLKVIAAFMLAAKTLALEVSQPSGEFAGKTVDELMVMVLQGAEQHYEAMPRQELLNALKGLADSLEVDFLPRRTR